MRTAYYYEKTRTRLGDPDRTVSSVRRTGYLADETTKVFTILLPIGDKLTFFIGNHPTYWVSVDRINEDGEMEVRRNLAAEALVRGT